MAITFQLKDKTRETSNIDIFIRFRGASYKKSTGETTPPKYWSQKKRRCNVPRDFMEGGNINTILTKWEMSAQKTIEHFKEWKSNPDKSEFWDYFDSIYYKDSSKKDGSFTCFLVQYIDSIRDGRAESTIKKYVTTLNKLNEYEKHRGKTLNFNDINIDFYNSFQQWIYRKGLSANYFGTLVKIIKRTMREANFRELIDSTKGIEHRDFVTINEETDKIYLTNEEIESLFNMDITADTIRAEFNEYKELTSGNMSRKVESMKVVRDRFLIGAYTGLRVSDFSRLESLNFGDKLIKTRTIKTGKPVVIPMHPNVRKILVSGFDPSVKISDQKMNKHLKELGRLAGIKEPVLLTENIGGKNVAKTYEKYKLICTHTARRSFATNALKAGVPLVSISKILGHKKISTTEKYLRMSAEEIAESLLNHPFFS